MWACCVRCACFALRVLQALQDYYMHQAGYGKPSALLLHALAHGQQQDDNFLLW